MGNLLAWLLPFAALALLVDGLFGYYIVDHYHRHACLDVPQLGLGMALALTGTAISIPFLWLQARRQVLPRRLKKSPTSNGIGPTR